MLRITIDFEDEDTVRMRLEGQVNGEWCSVLERACEEFFAQGKAVSLDMCAVTFIDDRGVRMFRERLMNRVRITEWNLFTQAIIHQINRNAT